MARVLLSLAIPSHLLFLMLTEVVNKKYFFTTTFLVLYLLVGVTQVIILLQLAYNFVHWLWSVGVNPDNTAIPFLTAFADLIGSLLLATAFLTLYAIKDPNAFTPMTFASGSKIQHHSQQLDVSLTLSNFINYH